MSTILTTRGYHIIKDHYDEEDIEDLKKECMVTPYSAFDTVQPTPSFRVYKNSKTQLVLPRHYGYETLGTPDIDRVKDFIPQEIDLKFNGSLRKEQQDIVDKYLEHKDTGGGIVSIPCGGGKTVIALGIIAQLKVKCVVIVHKEFLVNQWKERIRQFLPDAKIGHIQAGTVVTKDCDIIIGMLQSLSMKEYPPDTFSDIGLAVYDECHHLGAEVFSRCFYKVTAKYNLGLSATLNRKDGLSKVFKWFIGPVIYSRKDRDENDTCDVQVYRYKHKDPLYSKVCLRYNKQPDYIRMLTNIVEWEDRDNLILKVLVKNIIENRNVIILSDRLKHLERLFIKIKSHTVWDGSPSLGYYKGGMSELELKNSESKQVILGTFKMASEGMDIPHLDTLFLISPKSDIEQSVGRILRLKVVDRVNIPRVVDISDTFSMFRNQESKRLAFYKKNKYPTQVFNEKGEFVKNIDSEQKKKKEIVFNRCII
jgi:superfamily II DNA or RNA helicase